MIESFPKTMDDSDPLQSVNVIEVHYLAAVVKNNLEGVLVVDSRSFLEYNTSHVINAINVSCSKIIKRRLQQDKLHIKELLAHTCQCEADESCDVIVYDQNSPHTSTVPVDSFLHVLLRKLVPVFHSVNLVCGGFLEFQAAYPSLREHKTRKSTTLTSVSQPCLPVTNLGPTKILPFVFLGSQNDALNKEIVQQYNITYELNVSTSCPKPDFIADSQFMRIPVNDNYSEKLIPHFPAAFQFLDRVRESNACVLIHCLAGISRSATVAIAYVMKHLRMSSDDAYRYVKSKRATISPNFNFLGQLLEFERQLKCLQVLNVESGFSSAVIVSESNQKKRPSSTDHSALIRSLSLTLPETKGYELTNKGDQSPTTAFAKLSFRPKATEQTEVEDGSDDEKCPCSLKRRKEESDVDSDILSHTSGESNNSFRYSNPDLKSYRTLYSTYSSDHQPFRCDISKSQKWDFTSSYNSYQTESRKSSYSCSSERRNSSDSLKFDNFDIEVQGIPFSSLSELSFTPCQTSASSSASNSHEGTPERSFGFSRVLNRRAGSETRILNYDSRSRRSPTPSSLSTCSSQKSSRRGSSGTTDDDSDALLRRYNSATWYIPSLESIDSGSNLGRKYLRNDSISTSGLGSDVSDLSDLLNEVHSACESLVSDASCSSLCSSSLSRGGSIGSRHDLLRPLSVSSSSEAMMTDNESECGEGHLSDVEEEIEEEDESVVFRCDRQSPQQDMNTKRSSSDSAYQSLNEASSSITDLLRSDKHLQAHKGTSDNFIAMDGDQSPVSPSETTFSEDVPPITDSCSSNDSGTKMEVDKFLKMWGYELQDSLGASHDSGISLASNSVHWNEPKEVKSVSLDQVSEEAHSEMEEACGDQNLQCIATGDRFANQKLDWRAPDTPNANDIRTELNNNSDSSDVNNSSPCDNVSYATKKDRKWEAVLKEKLAFFANLSKEIRSELQRNSTHNAGLYRAQSCPGILGILMQNTSSSSIKLDSSTANLGSERLRQKATGRSRILDKFRNRYSCGSLEYTTEHEQKSICFESCPDVLHFDNCTNENKSSDQASSSPLSPNHRSSFSRGNSIIQVS